MLIPVPPLDSYDAPEGKHRAVCIEVRDDLRPSPGAKVPYLRIIWELKDMSDNRVRYLVGKNYEPNLASRSHLRMDLRTWFGSEINASEFDTKSLQGKESTLTVVHIHNSSHANPYCWVSKVEPETSEEDVFDLV